MQQVRRALFAAFVLGGAAMLGLAACGSSNAPASQAPSSSAPSSQRGGPAAAGSIASLAASSIEVQNPTSGQVTVNYTGTVCGIPVSGTETVKK